MLKFITVHGLRRSSMYNLQIGLVKTFLNCGVLLKLQFVDNSLVNKFLSHATAGICAINLQVGRKVQKFELR